MGLRAARRLVEESRKGSLDDPHREAASWAKPEVDAVRGHPLRLDDAGSRGGRASRASSPRSSVPPHACAVSSCTDRAAPGAARGGRRRRATRSSPSATRTSPRRTPSATAGRVPVFVDIDPDTYNMDPEKLEPAITAAHSGHPGVHQMGMPCDLEAILDGRRTTRPAGRRGRRLCDRQRDPGGRWWEQIGKPHGDIACFSFHPRKVITTGDGGMLTTSRPGVGSPFPPLATAQHERAGHRASRRQRGRSSSRIRMLGFNYRMTDIQAAVGPSPAAAPSRDHRSAPGARPSATGICSPTCPVSGCRRARLGAHQLAELLRQAARGSTAEGRDAGTARRGHRHPPGRHVRASGTSLPIRSWSCRRRGPASVATSCEELRHSEAGPGPLHPTAALSPDVHDDQDRRDRDSVKSSRSRAYVMRRARGSPDPVRTLG